MERSLTAVKVAKPKQDMRFDVPVIGIGTITAMQQAGATCLAIEAERTLIFDLEAVTAAANQAGISIVADVVPLSRRKKIAGAGDPMVASVMGTSV